MYAMLEFYLSLLLSFQPTLSYKDNYKNNELIKASISGANKCGEVGYVNLESLYEGHWYAEDMDIRIITSNAVSPRPLKALEVISYSMGILKQQRSEGGPGKYRFVLVCGPDIHNCTREYKGKVFTIMQ
jgi:hypothetical protein